MPDNQLRVREGIGHWMMRGHPGHTLAVPKDGRWQFNGDFVKPTFSPSILEAEPGGHHYFIRDGVAEYLPDKPCQCGDAERFWIIPPWNDHKPEGSRQ